MSFWPEPIKRKRKKRSLPSLGDNSRRSSGARALVRSPPATGRAHNLFCAPVVLAECECLRCRARRHTVEPMPAREPSFDRSKGEKFDYAKDVRAFDYYLGRQWRFMEPKLPRFPLIEWLAVQIYYWYGPVSWTVDLAAEDWLSQLREADERNSFSMAECRAQAAKWGYVVPVLEEMMLQYITREPLIFKPEDLL